jgi:hypothetical protein
MLDKNNVAGRPAYPEPGGAIFIRAADSVENH